MYLKKLIQNELKHNNENCGLNLSVLGKSLWYFTSKQSYIQRTSRFDKSWLSVKNSDIYVLLLVLKIFELDKIYVYKNQTEMNQAIRDLKYETSINRSLMYIYDNQKKPLFTVLFDDIRNALAHGGFCNCNGSKAVLLNQKKSKYNEKITFLLQSNVDLNFGIERLQSCFLESLENIEGFKINCLKDPLNIEIDDENVAYSHVLNKRILINDDFKFETKQHNTELAELVTNYSGYTNSILLISENLGNTNKENFKEYNDQVIIKTTSDLKKSDYIVNLIEYR